MASRNMTNIIVGCGGSGARTVLGLLGLMAQDPRWRHEMDESIFFLLVDTDKRELEGHEQAIRRVAPPGVNIQSIHTTTGFRYPGEIVEQFKEAIGNDPEALRRVAEHWWCKNPQGSTLSEAVLFTVPEVRSVMAGAGQVPMVSFLAAWQAMRDNQRSPVSIEGMLEGIYRRIGTVRAPIDGRGGKPLDDFNIVFLGSVAGGTGRGCAVPIAFKMKEVLERELGSQPVISCYFLNEDCFESGRKPHETLPQIMNAMTGWSELSAWFAVKDQVHKDGMPPLRYSLPGTTHPAMPEYDVLGATGTPLVQLPFDSVGVIGRANTSGLSASRDDIYSMVAAGLYVDITQSKLQSADSNEGRRYRSIGTVVVEVPYEDLQAYYTDLARFKAATKLTETIGQAAVGQESNRVLAQIGLGDRALEEFLEATLSQEPRTVMQSLAKDFLSEGGVISDRVKPVVAALEAQDLERARAEVESAVSESSIEDLAKLVAPRYLAVLVSTLNAGRAEGRVEGAMGVMSALEEALAGAEGASLDSSVLGRHGSAEAVRQVANEVIKALADRVEGQGAFSKDAVDAWLARRQDRPAIEVLEHASKREGFLGIGGRRFSSDEVADIASAVETEVRCLCARALAKAVATSGGGVDRGFGLLVHAREKMAKLVRNAKLACDAARQFLAEEEISSQELQGREDRLFSFPERLDASIVSSDLDTQYLLRRRVRPLRPDDATLQLDSGDLMHSARSVLLGDSVGERQAASVLREGLLRARYQRKEGNEPLPVLSKLTLKQALRELTPRWEQHLSNLSRTDRERFKRTEQFFRNFFGVQPHETDGKVSLCRHSDSLFSAAGEDFLMLGLASVASRSCRPFWKTARGASTHPHLTVLVPIKVDKAGDWVSFIAGAANLGPRDGNNDLVELISNDGEGTRTGFNEYVMVIHTLESVASLDQVQSLDGWSSNATARKSLAAADTHIGEGSMPFREKQMWDGYRGSGFTDPAYIYEERLRKGRWRPWAEDHVAMGKAQRSELLRALIYAWVGPEWFVREALGLQGASQRGPILDAGKRQSVVLRRWPVVFQEGYDRSSPLELHAVRGSTKGQMAEKALVCASLNELASAMEGPRARADLNGLRDAILREWESFLEHVATEAQFHPRNPKGYARVLDGLKGYLTDRMNRATDPMHPATAGTAGQDDEFASSSDAFWRDVGAALDEADQAARR